MSTDDIVAKYLRTPAGKRALTKTMLHGHRSLYQAIRSYYVPRLLAAAKGWRIL